MITCVCTESGRHGPRRRVRLRQPLDSATYRIDSEQFRTKAIALLMVVRGEKAQTTDCISVDTFAALFR